MLELTEKVIKTSYNSVTCLKRVKCRHGRYIKKKMTQIELKLEPTISEMKNIPDGINPH